MTVALFKQRRFQFTLLSLRYFSLNHDAAFEWEQVTACKCHFDRFSTL